MNDIILLLDIKDVEDFCHVEDKIKMIIIKDYLSSDGINIDSAIIEKIFGTTPQKIKLTINKDQFEDGRIIKIQGWRLRNFPLLVHFYLVGCEKRIPLYREFSQLLTNYLTQCNLKFGDGEELEIWLKMEEIK